MVNSGWNPNSFNLTNMLVQLHMYNNDPLFNSYVGVDLKNSTARILVVSWGFSAADGGGGLLVACLLA